MASGPDLRRRDHAHGTRSGSRGPDHNPKAPPTSDSHAQHPDGTRSKPAGAVTQEKAKENKTFMDRWVEPSLAAPAASYQDHHGGAAYGVLEHMQPLGEAPNAKVRARVKLDAGPARKSLLGRTSASASASASASSVAGAVPAVERDAFDTPEGSPVPLPAERHRDGGNGRDGAGTRGGVHGMVDGAGDDDDDDDDYAPHAANGKKRERPSRARAAKRASTTTAVTPSAAAAVAASASPASAMPSSSRKRKSLPACDTYDSKSMRYDDKKLSNVVDAAKRRAVVEGKPEAIDVLDVIHGMALRDQKCRALVDLVLCRKETEEQMAAFQVYVRAAKKQLKEKEQQKAKQANGRSQPSSSTKANDSQVVVSDTHKGSVNATGGVKSASPSGETYKPMTVREIFGYPAPTPRRAKRSSTAPRRSLNNAAAAAVPSTEVIPPKPRLLSLTVRSPTKTADMSGTSKDKATAPVNSKSPRMRNRTKSQSSESSLTSFSSEIEEPDVPMENVPSARSHTNGVADGRTGRSSLAAPGGAQLKRSSAEAELDDDEHERTIQAKKLRMHQSLQPDMEARESNVRPAMEEPQPPTEGSARSRSQRLRLRTSNAAGTTNSNGQVATASHSRNVSMDLDSPLSDLSPVPTSTESTPRRNGHHLQPTGKRAKTKQSPEKKATAGYGAVSGASGVEGESPIGDDDNEELGSENNDYCSACRGSGYLLCCDGCDRSFHFTCLDPPLSEDAKELDEPWYCFVCVAKRPAAAQPPEKSVHGLFAPLLTSLRKRNPSNFVLPDAVRLFFEGVSADKNGEFVEAVRGKTTRSSRSGYTDDQLDYFRLRDSKGNLILCYHCGKSASNRRAIVICDYCGQPWHLDCLDPPLANPPALNQGGHKVHDWMCPLHADHDMRTVSVSRLGSRTFHMRKPRNPVVVETALSRGHRNNGIIEVASEDEDGSDGEFYDHDDGKTVYKLPAHGIKLDFIDKVKQTRIQQLRDHAAFHRLVLPTPSTPPIRRPSALQQANFAKRPFDEKHVALALAQFATTGTNQDLNLGGDNVENLVGTLIAEAPAAVVRDIVTAESQPDVTTATATPNASLIPPSPPASEQPDPLTPAQRKDLLALQELIRRRLESCKT